MKSNFQIDQTIALESKGSYFDLHNSFDFVGYEYRPTEKKIGSKKGDSVIVALRHFDKTKHQVS